MTNIEIFLALTFTYSPLLVWQRCYYKETIAELRSENRNLDNNYKDLESNYYRRLHELKTLIKELILNRKEVDVIEETYPHGKRLKIKLNSNSEYIPLDKNEYPKIRKLK